MSEASQIPTFEVGLVLAGAISAGAYTAGVMDFLIEALDAWEDAKASGDPSVPIHRVMIRALGGASAGAMTAAVAAVALNSEVDPIRDIDTPPAAERNRLFDAWVRQITAEKLLGDADLRQRRRERRGVASLLDASALDAIAKVALHARPRRTPRAYVSDPLPVLLTLANLRGVPYGFQFAGPHGTDYEMLNHADHMRFSVTRNGTHRADEVVLDPVDVAGKNWRLLADAALASGAFPIGLSSRLLSRPFADYDDRIKGVRPQWFRDHKGVPNDPYAFRCVDGGLLDNEPLELVRCCLTGDESGQKHNERSGKAANRAVILVDPFPNRVDFNPGSYADKDGFFRTIGSVFYTLLEQSRFKPEELKLAADPTVFSRFMVFPTEMTIASAILSGFGGFLAEEYRRHDFQLGRRNCQWFLRRYFVLPQSNILFKNWKSEAHTRFSCRNAYYVSRRPTYAANGPTEGLVFIDPDKAPAKGGERMLPIIPLLGSAATEVPRPGRPSDAAVDKDALLDLLRKRVGAIGDLLIDTDLGFLRLNRLERWATHRALHWWLMRKLIPVAEDQLTQALGSLEGQPEGGARAR